MARAPRAVGAPPVTVPLLAADGLTKAYGSVVACRDVSFAIGAGEIVALLGENGAGKSTLVKMLFGALEPDAGAISWRGSSVRLTAPQDARRLGIAMVHQHFSLFEAFTVAENLALVLPDVPLPAIAARATELSRAYGLALDPGALVADLSAGERQRVEVVRCLLEEPQVLILDEPTSVLTPQEAERLFATLRRLRAEGRAVLYISHKLEEVRALCDRAVVLRQGAVVATIDPKRETGATLAAHMMGEAVVPAPPPTPSRKGRPALAVRGLTVPPPTELAVTLSVPALEVALGEVVGVAGIAGNGQRELFAAVSGEVVTNREAIAMFDAPVGDLGIEARRALGAAFAPEERIGHAAAPHLSLWENVVLSRHRRVDATVGPLGLLRRRVGRALAARVIEGMDVRTRGPLAPARALSGGNLQKFVVGRELDREPALLVVNQPTWGVDTGAAARIHRAILDRAAAGTAVLVISQDLDELFALCHRIAVLAGGVLSTARRTDALTGEEVGLLMAGADTFDGDRELRLAS